METVLRNLYKTVAIADSGTLLWDIKDKQNLHGLFLRFDNVNGATAGLALADMITSIRLTMNGNVDIIVGTANTLRDIAHDAGVAAPVDAYGLGAGAAQTLVVPILFGQELVDVNYFLQMQNVDSLQLRIDYAFTVAATGVTTGTGKASLTAIYSYGGTMGQYKGYIKTRSVNTWTSLASGDTITLLPFNVNLVSVHMSANVYNTDITTKFSNVRYQANQGDRVYYNDDLVKLRQIENMISPCRPWLVAGTLSQASPSIVSYLHDPMDQDVGFVPANTYKYLEWIATNASAGTATVVSIRDAVV